MTHITTLFRFARERVRRANPERVRVLAGGLMFLTGLWLFPLLTIVLCAFLFVPPVLVIALAEVEKIAVKRRSR